MLSIIVLAWDQLRHTKACVESLRQSTDVPYELIIVDNGSEPDASRWAEKAADIAVLNEENQGFARGMNAGLAAASGDVVGFVNNDTEWPEGWAGPVLEHFANGEHVGIVAPAVTAAGNDVTVRDHPRDEVVTLDPFSALPSGVAYFMHTDVIRELGGWTERYRLAMSEDLDLCFTCWCNGLDVIVDARTLVEHALHVTLESKIPDRQGLWRENLDQFLDFWTTATPDGVPRLQCISDEEFAANVRHARAAATWIHRLDAVRSTSASEVAELKDRLRAFQTLRQQADHGPLARRLGRRLRRTVS